MFHLQQDDFPVDTHVSIVLFKLVQISLHYFTNIKCPWSIRCLRFQRPLVGSQPRQIGIRPTFILTNGSQRNLNSIWIVFSTHMVSSVVIASRKGVTGKEKNLLVIYVLCLITARNLIKHNWYGKLMDLNLMAFVILFCIFPFQTSEVNFFLPFPCTITRQILDTWIRLRMF